MQTLRVIHKFKLLFLHKHKQEIESMVYGAGCQGSRGLSSWQPVRQRNKGRRRLVAYTYRIINNTILQIRKQLTYNTKHMHTHTHAHTNTNTCTHKHRHTQTHARTNTNTCTHKHRHTQTHANTDTHVNACLFLHSLISLHKCRYEFAGFPS